MNFKEQARASIEQLDAETVEAAQKRVDAILGTQAENSLNPSMPSLGIQAGLTLIPNQDSLPQAPATRKTRSDKGTHKPKVLADPDEIVLKMSVAQARTTICKLIAEDSTLELAMLLQDQIIAQLQKRIDLLQKSVPK